MSIRAIIMVLIGLMIIYFAYKALTTSGGISADMENQTKILNESRN